MVIASLSCRQVKGSEKSNPPEELELPLQLLPLAHADHIALVELRAAFDIFGAGSDLCELEDVHTRLFLSTFHRGRHAGMKGGVRHGRFCVQMRLGRNGNDETFGKKGRKNLVVPMCSARLPIKAFGSVSNRVLRPLPYRSRVGCSSRRAEPDELDMVSCAYCLSIAGESSRVASASHLIVDRPAAEEMIWGNSRCRPGSAGGDEGKLGASDARGGRMRRSLPEVV